MTDAEKCKEQITREIACALSEDQSEGKSVSGTRTLTADIASVKSHQSVSSSLVKNGTKSNRTGITNGKANGDEADEKSVSSKSTTNSNRSMLFRRDNSEKELSEELAPKSRAVVDNSASSSLDIKISKNQGSTCTSLSDIFCHAF